MTGRYCSNPEQIVCNMQNDEYPEICELDGFCLYQELDDLNNN